MEVDVQPVSNGSGDGRIALNDFLIHAAECRKVDCQRESMLRPGKSLIGPAHPEKPPTE